MWWPPSSELAEDLNCDLLHVWRRQRVRLQGPVAAVVAGQTGQTLAAVQLPARVERVVKARVGHARVSLEDVAESIGLLPQPAAEP